MKLLLDKFTRIERNQNFYQLELKIHKKNVPETKRCLKSYMDYSVYKTVIEDVNAGYIRRNLPWIENFLEKSESRKWLRWLLKKVKQIVNTYGDIAKDIVLVASIISALGGPAVLFLTG